MKSNGFSIKADEDVEMFSTDKGLLKKTGSSFIKCKCGIQGDGTAIVCKPHYSIYMRHNMQTYLVTTESFAKKIWKKLKVKIS